MTRTSGNGSASATSLGGSLHHHGRIICAFMAIMALASVRAGQHAENLSVITWNVWGLPFITPERPVRIDQIVTVLSESEADIISVQEAWLPADISKLKTGLEAAGYRSLHFRSFPLGSGLIIFSRFPMTSPKFEAFRYGGKPHKPWHGDWYAGKGFGSVRVETHLGPLIVVNTHLHACYKSSEYLVGQLAQMVDLARGIDSLTEQGKIPCLLMGDLNSLRDSLSFRLLSELTALRPAKRAPDCIDWILARDGVGVNSEVTRAGKLFVPPLETGTPLSDHKPVFGVITMKSDHEAGQVADAAAATAKQEAGDLLQPAAHSAMTSGIATAIGAILMVFAWCRLRTSRRNVLSKIFGSLALLSVMILAYHIYLWHVFSQAQVLLREHF